MSNKRPDELPSVSSITSGDILIAEINPDNGGTRRVVKITKENLLSDINDGGLSGLLNAGAGSGLVSGIASQVGYIKSLAAGTNIQISGDESTLYFNVTGVGGGGDGSGVTSFTNLGAGSGIASGVDGTTGYFKSLVGGTNLQISGDDESLYLDVTGVSSAFTGSVIKMTGCTLYASGDQVGINTCEPADGYSLHVSGDTLASGKLDVQGDIYSAGTYISGNYLVGVAAQILYDQDIGGNLLVGDTLTLGVKSEYPTGDGNLEVYGDKGITVGPFEGGTAGPLDESGSLKIFSGIYLPTLNTADRDAIDIERKGFLLYNAEEDQFQGYNGTEWVNLGSGSGGSSTTGITGATNLGAGSGLISGITDNDLQVKSLVGGTNLQITGDGESLYLNVTGISGGSGGSGITGASNIGAGDGLISGVLNDDIKVKSLIGGSNISLAASSNSITINSIGGGGGGGGTFAFFSNALNNAGIIEKTYYPTVDPNIYLSGIDVDNASDLTLYLRWDGPGNGYMGTGFINDQEIPTGNITQLGTSTRRFEGFISGLDLAGTTIITGVANGSTGTISLQEAGAGPTPFSVFMPPVSSGTAKAGTNLGSSDYKGGDTTTGYVTFDTTDVTGIKVFDHGVSDFIDFASYTLVDTGDARHTARIPLTINNTRNGSQTLKIIAVNNFGTTGAATESNAVTLDQTYPSVSATDPALSAYVNNQGLNSGESIAFVNTISNWDSANGDTVLYSGLSDQIAITDSGVFQNPKTVSYVTGVYNNSDNITITAARDDNGAVDSTDVKIRIAKNPIITGIILQPYALSATSPNVVGTSEIKGGDVGSAEVVVNTNEVSAGNMTFSVSNAGVSDGSQTAYTSASSSTTLPDGTIVFAINLNITSSVARDGAQSVTVTARNNFGTTSPSLTSAASATVNNAEFPSLTAGPVSYPANQSALKDTESATVTNTAATYDTIIYTSPGSELTISNPNTFEGSKNVDRLGGTYNISTDNFTATATKASNGMVRDASTVVNIANTAAAFTINNLASSIQINTGQSVIDNFDLDINQILYENPALYLDYTQVPQSTLTATAQGTGTTANNYRITVAPSDGKGEFTFSGSGLNLAGKETFSIGTNPNYIISGIVEGEAYISDQSPCAGLIYLGGPMINPSTISMENVSEGGAGPNGGTVYTYQAYANGTSVDCTTDADNKFAIVTSGAGGGIGTLLSNTTGDHLFNLDQTNRQANTSAPGALIVISQT